MAKGSRSRVKFDAKKFGNLLYKSIAVEQTQRLCKYAEEELIKMAESHEFKDRTGQASNSYVWLVCYNGKKRKYGFSDKAASSGKSYLHEWSPSMREPVYGRKAARAFVNEYKPIVTNGWEIVWCAAAPYLGYHEGGFVINTKRGSVYYHFNVMSQRYDHIRNVLEPKCKVNFEINPPTY